MIFYALLVALIFQRLHEMRLGKENLAAVEDRLVAPPDQGEMKQMLVLHSAWFLSCGVEFFLRGELVPEIFFLVGIGVLVFCQWVRFQSMRTLGESWIHLPVAYRGQKIVNEGIYRFFKHPNYAVVAVEIAVVPLLGGAYFTSLIFSFLNILFLRRRIHWEEMQLEKVRQS